MQLPEGSLLLIITWVFIVFLLWNVYRFSQTFRQRAFIALVVLSAAGVLGGIVFLHFQQQSSWPGKRMSVLIFPLVNEAKDAATGTLARKIDSQSLASADMIGEHLQRAPNTPFYLIPTETLFDLANRDSLIYIDYVLRFAQFAKLQMIGFGAYRKTPSLAPAAPQAPANHHENWSADFELFDLRHNSPPSPIHLKLPEPLNGLQDLTAAAARAVLQTFSKADRTTLSPIWQSRVDGDFLQSYYSAKFALAMNQTAAALSQARTLWQTDTSRAQFVNLYARTVITDLGRKQATEMEWNESLRAILPHAKFAARKDSLSSESARLLGEINIRLKKWNDAELALKQARQRDSTDSEIYPLLAQLHISRLQPLGFKNELELYRRAQALNPLNIAAGLAEADYLWRENHEPQAIAILEHLFKINPNHVEVLMSLGRIYIAKNNEAKIFETYERLLQMAPDNAEAYYNLGIVYYHREDFDNAIKFFERAIKLNNHLEARLYLASIYERRGNIDQAIQYLRERIRMSRGDDDKYADEARRRLYEILLARGEIPAPLRPDSLK